MAQGTCSGSARRKRRARRGPVLLPQCRDSRRVPQRVRRRATDGRTQAGEGTMIQADWVAGLQGIAANWRNASPAAGYAYAADRSRHCGWRKPRLDITPHGRTRHDNDSRGRRHGEHTARRSAEYRCFRARPCDDDVEPPCRALTRDRLAFSCIAIGYEDGGVICRACAKCVGDDSWNPCGNPLNP